MPKVLKPSLKKIAKIAEPLSTAGAGRWACQQCALFKKCTLPFTRPEVPDGWSGRLLLIGEGDGHGGVFDRAARKLLRRLWQGAGYSDRDVAMVNAVRCFAGAKGTAPSMNQIRACRPYLLKVISALKPGYILAMGATAFRALRDDGSTNITRNRGKDFGGEFDNG